MQLLHRYTSANDFAVHIKELITFFDNKIFITTAPAYVDDDDLPSDMTAVAAFYPLRTGEGGEYAIYEKSKNLVHLSTYSQAVDIAVHEVRHRYQLENPDAIISYQFLRTIPNIHTSLIDQIYAHAYVDYHTDQDMLRKEFDALVLHTFVSSFSGHSTCNVEKVTEIITCNEKTFGNIIQEFH